MENGNKNELLEDVEININQDDIPENLNETQNENENENEKKEQKVEEKKEKKRNTKPQYRFKPFHLTDANKGLKFLYNNMNRIQIDKYDNNQDEFIRYLREWHYLLFPKYDFNYFLDRCQHFGNTPQIKAYMSRMRRAHIGELNWKDLDEDNENKINEGNIDKNSGNFQNLNPDLFQKFLKKNNENTEINSIENIEKNTEINKNKNINNNKDKIIEKNEKYDRENFKNVQKLNEIEKTLEIAKKNENKNSEDFNENELDDDIKLADEYDKIYNDFHDNFEENLNEEDYLKEFNEEFMDIDESDLKEPIKRFKNE